MKRTLTVLLILFSISFSYANQLNLVIHKHYKDTVIKSSFLKYGKDISVYLPRNYDAEKSYPLLVHFDKGYPQTDLTLKQIDYLAAYKQIPEFIMFTITSKPTYVPRALEVLLPDMTQSNPQITTEMLKKEARGYDLEQFLFRELIPYAKSNFSVDNNQIILAGHSFYGYYTSYLFSEHFHELFAVISSSPYFNFGNLDLTTKFIDKLSAINHLPHKRHFYYGIGSSIGGDDRNGYHRMVEALENAKLPDNFIHKAYDFPNTGHNVVPILTTANAMSEIYSQWFINYWSNDSQEQKDKKLFDYYGFQMSVPIRK